MKMKHPKTCDGCKAFWQSQVQYNCSLGYELKVSTIGKVDGTDIHRISPKCGACPKPRTIKELLESPVHTEEKIDETTRNGYRN
jgi:hypothetical protein